MSDVAYWNSEATSDPRYARAAWGMDDTDKDGHRAIPRILERLEAGLILDIGTRVLEIGCGPCRLLLRLAQRYPLSRFFGVDISPEMLFIANLHINDSTAGNITVEDIGGLYRGIDLVYAVELMQHLDDEAAATVIREAQRSLKVGGMFKAQFVRAGEPGPHSFPRDEDAVRELMGPGWSPLQFLRAVHPDWLWVAARKR